MFKIFNIFLAVKSSHTSTTSRSNSLAITSILHITTSKYAWYIGFASSWLHDNVSIHVGIDLSTKEACIRMMTDRYEYASSCDQLFFTSLIIKNLKSSNTYFIRNNLNRRSVQGHFYLFVIAHTILHDLGATKLITTVYKRYFGSKTSQESCFF
ncbi:hypothetical protein D3C81_1611930 [compost metagenome]